MNEVEQAHSGSDRISEATDDEDGGGMRTSGAEGDDDLNAHLGGYLDDEVEVEGASKQDLFSACGEAETSKT